MLTIDFDQLRLSPGSRVLDLGCGSGRHVRATRLMPGVAAVALDIQAHEATATAQSLKSMDTGDPLAGPAVSDAGPWLVLRGDTYRLPFHDCVFDCVIASEILEHLHDDDAALREVTRVLKPRGWLAVSVPRWVPEAVCWALSSEYRRSEGGHVRIYRRGALKRKLNAHGYQVFAYHFAHALHSPYWWLKCVTGINREQQGLVRRYHQFLVWDLFHRPRITRLLERALNPFIGKSVVMYARRALIADCRQQGNRRSLWANQLAAGVDATPAATLSRNAVGSEARRRRARRQGCAQGTGPSNRIKDLSARLYRAG